MWINICSEVLTTCIVRAYLFAGVAPTPHGSGRAEEPDKRIPAASLTFAMSDVSSSEEDEAFPETKRKQITVIDLASDSDSS